MSKSERKKRKKVEVKDVAPKDAGPKGGVALGDVNRDGSDDVIVSAGPGGGPHVRVFDGTK